MNPAIRGVLSSFTRRMMELFPVVEESGLDAKGFIEAFKPGEAILLAEPDEPLREPESV